MASQNDDERPLGLLGEDVGLARQIGAKYGTVADQDRSQYLAIDRCGRSFGISCHRIDCQ